MHQPALEAMRASPIFCGLRNEDLEDLVHQATHRTVEPGSCLIAEGDYGQSLLVILSGEVEVVREAGNGEAALARFGPGAFVGEMALIDNAPRTATVRSITRAEIMEITKEQFDRLLDESPDACRAVVQAILRRLKSTEAMLVNQEKLAGLGRLSAGLAHELNNPASAVGRFADQLLHSFEDWRIATGALVTGGEPSDINTFLSESYGPQNDDNHLRRSVVEQADIEDDLAQWIQSKGIDDPWDAASNLASAGWTVSDLEAMSARLQGVNLTSLIHWLSAEAEIRTTLRELRTSAQRLSEVVGGVKNYSHMDRAAIERFNVNRGLENTVVILRHKLKNIDLHIDLDPELPEIEGYPGELNQVWTNLIDNAIDAMHGEGRLEIRSLYDEKHVIVSVTDSGAGITESHQRRLFEPFFTTKEVGVGTGLGLHISHNIVVQRHGGRIDVSSRPGETTFTVRLPRER